MSNGQDFATFNIDRGGRGDRAPDQGPPGERRYWGDKSDFCRCLKVVFSEMAPRADRNPAPSSYMLFCRDKRLQAKEAGRAAQLDDKELGAMWKGLNDEERKPWTEKAEQIEVSGATLAHEAPCAKVRAWAYQNEVPGLQRRQHLCACTTEVVLQRLQGGRHLQASAATEIVQGVPGEPRVLTWQTASRVPRLRRQRHLRPQATKTVTAPAFASMDERERLASSAAGVRREWP